MLVTIKLNYIQQESIDRLVDILEVPSKDVVQLLIDRVLLDKELLDKLLNQVLLVVLRFIRISSSIDYKIKGMYQAIELFLGALYS